MFSFSFRCFGQREGTHLAALVRSFRHMVNAISNSPAKMELLRHKQKDPDAVFLFEIEAAEQPEEEEGGAFEEKAEEEGEQKGEQEEEKGQGGLRKPHTFDREAWVKTLKLIKDVVTRFDLLPLLECLAGAYVSPTFLELQVEFHFLHAAQVFTAACGH